jgi:hypothetical protein
VGLQVRFGYQTPRCDGNYAWADILLSEHYIEGTVGEHFYDPDVGGDTESSVLFYREIGGSSDYGSMKEWLARFDDVSEYGQWTIEEYVLILTGAINSDSFVIGRDRKKKLKSISRTILTAVRPGRLACTPSSPPMPT